MKARSKIFLLVFVSFFISGHQPYQHNAKLPKSILDEILARGYIEIGVTGDYVPFAYFDKHKNTLKGIDIELAEKLALDLEVELRIVETTRSKLLYDLLNRKFDVAMSGISRTLKRSLLNIMTTGYFETGKSLLVRNEDQSRFSTLKDVDKEGIKMGVNIGGTNEIFARQFIKKAEVIFFENNLEIPQALLGGELDVMLTDNVEAKVLGDRIDELYAVDPYNPFNQEVVAFALPPGDSKWLSFLNLWLLHQIEVGEIDRLQKVWIGE
ncbi:MAG: transporter substrate-binding domain-containing protein [Bacteroidota bacterium]